MPPAVEREPIAAAPVSVILLGEENTADRDEVVAAWRRFLDSLQRPHEILLVGVGADPATPGATDLEPGSSVRIVPLEAGARPGAALRAGIAAAQHPLLAYAPLDKSFQPNDLQLLLERIDKVDLVTGYRVWGTRPWWLIWLDRLQRLLFRVFLGMSREPRTTWLGWRGWRRRWLARWLFGVQVQDPECPFRLFRRAIFERMPLQCDGPFAHVELLAKANFLGCWMSEVPVTWLPAATRASFSAADGGQTRRDIIRLFRRPEFLAMPPAQQITPCVSTSP